MPRIVLGSWLPVCILWCTCQGSDERLFDATGGFIINGVPDNNPAHAAVVGLSNRDAFCTGTLIGRRVVLTAAHCVSGSNAESFSVMFGDTIYQATHRSVSETRVHPGYNSTWVLNDIAMLRLDGDAPLEVAPIPFLPHNIGIDQTDIGRPLEFVGFGMNEKGQMGTKLTVTNNLEWVCTSPSGCDLGGGLWGNPNTICIDQDPGGTCSGDSGGPAFIVRTGQEYVAGITSYGDGPDCQIYSCSTKVDEYQDFIREFAGQPEGSLCSSDRDCLSAHCAGGVCCESACAGRCLACSQLGFEGSCRPVPDGTSCQDGNLCNGDEVCLGGSCQPGEPLECHDSIACTYDTCDPTLGCFFRPKASECYDGSICTRNVCDRQSGCIFEPFADGLKCGKGMVCFSGNCQPDPNLDQGGCGCGLAATANFKDLSSPLVLLLLGMLRIGRRVPVGNVRWVNRSRAASRAT